MQKQHFYIVLHSHNSITILIIISNPDMYRDLKPHSEHCLRAVAQPLHTEAQARYQFLGEKFVTGVLTEQSGADDISFSTCISEN